MECEGVVRAAWEGGAGEMARVKLARCAAELGEWAKAP